MATLSRGLRRGANLFAPSSCSHVHVLTSAFHHFTRDASPKAIAAATHQDGACIIRNFYTPSQTQRFNRDIDAALAALKPGASAINETWVKEFHGSQTKRLWDLCTISETWRRELIDHELMHAVCEEGIGEIYGDYWLSTAQMIEIGPGSEAQPLHVDGAQWWPFWEMDKDKGNQMLLNFLVACTDTTVQNGATCVISGSHKFDYSDIDPDSAEQPDMWRGEDAVSVELKAGDCLIVGGRIVHRGGANTTTDDYRRVLTSTVVSSAFTPEEAAALVMGDGVRRELSERAKRFVGLRGQRPLGSIGVWQEQTGDMKNALGV